MVSMAAFIADNCKKMLIVGGGKKQQNIFPSDLKLVNADGSAAGVSGTLKGEKVSRTIFVISMKPI